MFRKIWEWIKRPHGWALLLFYIFTAICVAGALYFCAVGQEAGLEFVAYLFYACAAVTFFYTVYTIVIFVPVIKRKITKRLKTNRFAANILDDYHFKTTVLAFLSFGITIAFALLNLVSAIWYRLIWYGAIAAYYIVLIVFRGGILFANKKCAKRFADNAEEYEKSKIRIYLASGIFLFLLEFAMMGAAVTQMVLSKRPVQSGEIMTISNAAYAFLKISMAVYNLVKAHKLSNPVTQSLRNLNFADACMSVVSLTALMISTFGGEDSAAEIQHMKYIVGFAVCAMIMAMAVFMIMKAHKRLKSYKRNGECKHER